MIAFIIWSGISVIFLLIGIFLWNAKQATGFFVGVNPPEIKDIVGYNRAVAKIWFVFTAVLEIIGIPLLFIKQNSPIAFLIVGGVVILVIAIMIAYIKVEKKYSEKRADMDLEAQFEFRSIREGEEDQAVAIEQICFPPHEACSEKSMKERIAKAPELFLVAVDKKTGKIAGFLSGLSTNEPVFRDEFFTDANLYEPHGKNVMLLGLDVLPKYRMQGLGQEIMQQYFRRERENGRELVILTCLQSKVEMYKKMGYRDEGISASVWGGEKWHEMSYHM